MARESKFPLPKSELFYFDEDEKRYKAIVDRDGLLPIQSVQKRWRDSFVGTELDTEKWEVLQKGAGQTVGVANNELQITTGVTPDEETILLSKQAFTNPYRVMYAMRLSQKIANQEVYLEAVTVDRTTGLPDGKGLVAWRVSGSDSVTNDYAVYQTQNGGTLLSSANVDTNVAHVGASTYGIFELEPFSDEVWFHVRSMDSTSGRTYSAVRHQQMPDPDGLFKLRIRVKNGTTAPASTTTVGIQFVNVVDYAELTAEITGGRGQGSAGQAMAVQVVNSISTITTAYVAPKILRYTDTVANITTTTPFTGTNRDTGTTQLYTTYRLRIFADQPLKVDVHAGSSSTLASNKVQQTINVPANTMTIVDIPLVAQYVGIKATNTGSANTTVCEIMSALMSVV
jgi:hypothetical protein